MAGCWGASSGQATAPPCSATSTSSTRSVRGSRHYGPRASDVEVRNPQRVGLDELAARLDLVAHERREDLAGADGVLDLHLEQDALGGIHGGFPELLGVHLAQPLVALVLHPALAFPREPVEAFLERAHRAHGLAALHLRVLADEAR